MTGLAVETLTKSPDFVGPFVVVDGLPAGCTCGRHGNEITLLAGQWRCQCGKSIDAVRIRLEQRRVA